MSVWISDEKLLIFASLISPSKMTLFEKKYQTFDAVFHHQMKHLEVRQKYSATYFQLSSRCFIWWWNTASHVWYITSKRMMPPLPSRMLDIIMRQSSLVSPSASIPSSLSNTTFGLALRLNCLDLKYLNMSLKMLESWLDLTVCSGKYLSTTWSLNSFTVNSGDSFKEALRGTSSSSLCSVSVNSKKTTSIKTCEKA